MLKDILGQAWEAMLYNRRRTTITMVGMAWGIATVVLLLAYGAGFTHAIEAIFAQWGTNIIGVFPGRTSEQAGGDKAGVKVRFTQDDVDRIIAAFPASTTSRPQCLQRRHRAERPAHLHLDRQRRPPRLSGHLEARYRRRAASSTAPKISSARTSASSARRPRPSCFPADGPSARPFVSTACSSPSSAFSAPRCRRATDNDRNRQIYVPFNTMSDLKDTKYLDGIWFNYQRRLRTHREEPARDAGGRRITSAPSDHNAIYVANIMTELHQFSILSMALAGPALLCRRAHARHRRHRPHEHHARRGAAAHPRNRH